MGFFWKLMKMYEQVLSCTDFYLTFNKAWSSFLQLQELLLHETTAKSKENAEKNRKHSVKLKKLKKSQKNRRNGKSANN